MEPNVPVSVLIEKSKSILKEKLKFSSSTVQRYESTGFKPIINFFDEIGTAVFTCDEAAKLRESYEKDFQEKKISRNVFNMRIKTLDIVVEVFLTGDYNYHRSSRKKREVPDIFKAVLDPFLNTLALSESYLKDIDYILIQYGLFLQAQGIFLLKEITFEVTTYFIRYMTVTRSRSIDSVVGAVRKFIFYLAANGYIPYDFSVSIYQPSKPYQYVQGVMTVETKRKMLSSLDRSTPIGLRDYAILLLAFKTGIRACDAAELNLTDIDWRRKCVNFVQKKTGKPHTLPLDDQLLHALADYILRGRPQTDCTKLFLRSRPPYIGFSGSFGIQDVFRHTLQKAGIEHIPHDGNTYHGARRTLGTNLINSGNDIGTVAELLGHSSTAPTKKYISLDIDGLRVCVMSISSLEKTK